MQKIQDPLAARLARRLRDLRGKGTIVRQARRLGVSKSSYHRMELGAQNVTLETLDILCARMKCDVAELFAPRKE